MLKFTVEKIEGAEDPSWLVTVWDEGETPFYYRRTGKKPGQEWVEVAWFMFRSYWKTTKPIEEAA